MVGTMLGLLAVLLAVQQAVLALMLRVGVPVEVVRLLRYAKEGVLLALLACAVVAVVRATRAGARPKPDLVDLAALAYLAVAVAYLALGVVAGDRLFPDAPRDPWLQLVGVRSLATGPLMLLVVRWASVDSRGRWWAVVGISAAAAVSGTVATFQMLAPERWVPWAERVIDYDGYQRAVFGRDLPDAVLTYTSFGPDTVVRAGGLMFDHLQLGFFLLAGLVLGLAAMVRSRGRDVVGPVLLVAASTAGLVATGTRSGLVAAVLAAGTLAIAWPDPVVRRRAMAAAAGLAIAAALLSVPTGVASRMVEGLAARDASSDDRLASLELGIESVVTNPWGSGIGTTAEVAPRADDPGIVVENAYLDLAVQLGLVGAVAFLLLLAAVSVALWRRRAADDLAPAALAVVVGLSAGSMFLPVWLMFETAWVAFALVGLALSHPATDELAPTLRRRRPPEVR